MGFFFFFIIHSPLSCKNKRFYFHLEILPVSSSFSSVYLNPKLALFFFSFFYFACTVENKALQNIQRRMKKFYHVQIANHRSLIMTWFSALMWLYGLSEFKAISSEHDVHFWAAAMSDCCTAITTTTITSFLFAELNEKWAIPISSCSNLPWGKVGGFFNFLFVFAFWSF